MSEALARVERNDSVIVFSAEQRQMIRDVCAPGASESEFAVFMEVARARRLNPLLKQIYIVKRWNSDLERNVWTPQTGIDGLRVIAERTGFYNGQDEAEFEYEGKVIKLARVRVWKKGIDRPFVGVAHFSEYAQTKRGGGLTSFWAEKPHIMLSKCAEALAMRKAFPEDLSGLYVPEEMGSNEEREINPQPLQQASPARVVEIVQPKKDEEKTPPSGGQVKADAPPPAAPGAASGKEEAATVKPSVQAVLAALMLAAERKSRKELDEAVKDVAKFDEADKSEVRKTYISLLPAVA